MVLSLYGVDALIKVQRLCSRCQTSVPVNVGVSGFQVPHEIRKAYVVAYNDDSRDVFPVDWATQHQSYCGAFQLLTTYEVATPRDQSHQASEPLNPVC